MITINALFALSGDVSWHFRDNIKLDPEEGLTVVFDITSQKTKHATIRKLRERITSTNIDWLGFEDNNWILSLDKIRNYFSKELKDLDWLKGEIVIEPEIETPVVIEPDTTVFTFIATKEYIVMSQPKKIFLSHKGIDKPYVREFKETLGFLGYTPWIDEEATVAGDEMERSLLQGFKESCAAVFFITPSFKDENFLATEINYAISEKRTKKDRFSIITLILSDKDGSKGNVPELLKQYVWKEPKNQLEALRDILRALPVEIGRVQWRRIFNSN